MDEIKFDEISSKDFDTISFDDINLSEEQQEGLSEPVKELRDEIKSFREKQKEFAATNDKETYLIVCFSTKEDKNEFLSSVEINTHTLVDGYELAKKLNLKPTKPTLELKKPLTKMKGV